MLLNPMAWSMRSLSFGVFEAEGKRVTEHWPAGDGENMWCKKPVQKPSWECHFMGFLLMLKERFVQNGLHMWTSYVELSSWRKDLLPNPLCMVDKMIKKVTFFSGGFGEQNSRRTDKWTNGLEYQTLGIMGTWQGHQSGEIHAYCLFHCDLKCYN